MLVRVAGIALGALALGGCATYHPLPLAKAPDLKADISALTVPADALHPPATGRHVFNPRDGLDAIEVAELAVVNNPQLRAARAKVGIVRAQLFAAGLLPDPQLGLSYEKTTTPSSPAVGQLQNAKSASLSESLTEIITRGARQAAQRAALRQVNLDNVWNEWQVAQQARQLCVRLRTQRRQLKIVAKARRLEMARYRRAGKALAAHNLTLKDAGPDLAALLDAETQMRTLERDLNHTGHSLNALLGLKPGVKLDLAGPLPAEALPDPAAYRQALAQLPARRPDLMALRAGYRSEDEQVRAAILAQFPSLSVGISRGVDNTGVFSTGLSINLSLPFFNGNRGQIAIARATRAQLHADYQARLDAAYGSLDELWRDMHLLHAQVKTLDARLPALRKLTHQARKAYAAGNLDALTYFTLETTAVSKESESISLHDELAEARIALETLLGRPLPNAQATQAANYSNPAPRRGAD